MTHPQRLWGVRWGGRSAGFLSGQRCLETTNFLNSDPHFISSSTQLLALHNQTMTVISEPAPNPTLVRFALGQSLDPVTYLCSYCMFPVGELCHSTAKSGPVGACRVKREGRKGTEAFCSFCSPGLTHLWSRDKAGNLLPSSQLYTLLYIECAHIS